MEVYHWTLGLFLVTYINCIINFMQIMYNAMYILYCYRAVILSL